MITILFKKRVSAILAFILLISCSEEGLERLGYGKEIPYATGVLKPVVVTHTTSTLSFDFKFVLFDEQGVVPADQFTIDLGEVTFNSGVKMNFVQKSLELVNAVPRGDCYDVALMMEHNAIERPERLELASRYILHNTDECNKFIFSYYPERSNDLGVISHYKIEGDKFISDPFQYDQLIAKVSFNDFDMHQAQTSPFESQHTALDSLLRFTKRTSSSTNKNVMLMYQNYNSSADPSLKELSDYAKANNIVIHVNKSNYVSDDPLMPVATETGGVYFIQEELDFWHARNKPDSYVMAVHADEVFSGNYSYYKARFDVTSTSNSFNSGGWFRVGVKVNLPNEVVKILPLYVIIP
jgi:hypothetical protein